MPKWNAGHGRRSSSSHMCLPLRCAARTVRPVSAAATRAPGVPANTIGSGRAAAETIRFPFSSRCSIRLADSASGSSGIPSASPRALRSAPAGARVRGHHTRQGLALTMGSPALHENAFWNSGMLETVPFMRHRPGLCGSVWASSREISGVAFWHQICAQPRNRRWSAVNPSMAAGSLPASVFVQRHVRDAQAAVVGHVLAQRQLAVQLHLVHRRVGAVLVHHAGGSLLELLAVGVRPPVRHVALRVELAAGVVESVRQLVPDHGADARRSSRRRPWRCRRTAAAGCRPGS